MSPPIKSQTNSRGETKDGEYHLRSGGYGTWKLKTYATEGALRTAYLNWLDGLIELEHKYSHEAERLLLEERQSVKGRALPLECELRGGMGNPFVARAWHEVPAKRTKSNKTTEHTVTNYQLESNS